MGIYIVTAKDGTEHEVDSYVYLNAYSAWGVTVPVLKEAFPDGTDADTVKAFLDDFAVVKAEEYEMHEGDPGFEAGYCHDMARADEIFWYLTAVEDFTVEQLLNWPVMSDDAVIDHPGGRDRQ